MSTVSSVSTSTTDQQRRLYSGVGLRTWGQNYYQIISTNGSLQRSYGSGGAANLTKGVVEQEETTPVVQQSVKGDAAQGRMDAEGVNSVSKHLNGMFDDIMKEMFSDRGQVEAAPEESEEEDFRIVACPSPTRQLAGWTTKDSPKRAVDMEMGGNCALDDDGKQEAHEVVLRMDDMSPLLQRMREIDRDRKDIASLNSSKSNYVSSMVTYFDQGGLRDSQSTDVGPLLPTHVSHGKTKPPLYEQAHDSLSSFLRVVKRHAIGRKVVNVVSDTVLPKIWGATRGPKRLMITIFALAYLVAIHVLLIASRLR
jgi:hypothetical protein